MRDLIFQGIVVLLPFFYGVGIEACPKEFRETSRYRRWVLICGALFSLITFCELGYERHKSTAERETAVEDSAAKTAAILGKQYAASDASQKLKIGELEGFIQSQGKDVRDVKKYTVANTAQIHALWEQNETGKQKRDALIDLIKKRIDRGVWVLSVCANVGPRGSGGVTLRQCVEGADSWTSEATGLLYGSLGPLYVDRFAGAVPTQLGGPSHGSDPRLELDPDSFSQWSQTIHEMDGRVNILKEFVKELAK
jgi:hypothetical protein